MFSFSNSRDDDKSRSFLRIENTDSNKIQSDLENNVKTPGLDMESGPLSNVRYCNIRLIMEIRRPFFTLHIYLAYSNCSREQLIPTMVLESSVKPSSGSKFGSQGLV